MSMMESGLASDMGGNAAGIFTELAILYLKYNEAKLMDHLKQFFSRMNIPRGTQFTCFPGRKVQILTQLRQSFASASATKTGPRCASSTCRMMRLTTRR
jgi:hypothetical protein